MELTIKEICHETPTVISLIFDKPPGFSFKPGQFMRFSFPIDHCDSRCNSRPFTLSSSPTEAYLMITTRLGPSALKKSLLKLKPGLIVRAIGPLGKFVLDETNHHVVMLAGGVGITPFRSMFKYIIDQKIKHPVTLLYSNSQLKEIVYQKVLSQWSKNYPNINIVHTITNLAESKKPWSGRIGRIDQKMVRDYILDIKNTQFYTSGPPTMVETIEEILRSLGIPENHIYTERFAGY